MRVPVVIDTDTFNEMDDQFAVAYALASPEKLEVRALLAAPFCNEKAADPAEGMRKSLAELLRVRALCHSDVPAYAGSQSYLPGPRRPVTSPACDALIRLARAMPDGQRLQVAAIAALTNVASALLKAPDIRDRVTVHWLGGHARDWEPQDEFNLRQDRAAAQAVLDSGAPVVWYPCMGVCSHLSLSLWEAEHWLRGRGELPEALCDLLAGTGATAPGQSRILWDLAPIAALCDPTCVRVRAVSAPIVTEGPLRFPAGRPQIGYVYSLARDRVFSDFFAAVGAPAPHPAME